MSSPVVLVGDHQKCHQAPSTSKIKTLWLGTDTPKQINSVDIWRNGTADAHTELTTESGPYMYAA